MAATQLANGQNTTIHEDTTTLQRLRALEQLYEQGYQDDIVDLTIYKLLEHQVQKDEAQLHRLKSDLERYEQQFGMASEIFNAKYQAGALGDDVDVFEWHVIYEMYLRLNQQEEISPNLPQSL
jgi:hypothetical protein